MIQLLRNLSSLSKKWLNILVGKVPKIVVFLIPLPSLNLFNIHLQDSQRVEKEMEKIDSCPDGNFDKRMVKRLKNAG